MTSSKRDLTNWLYEALRLNGGQGSIIELCKIIWSRHESELKASGDLFYTWQYDVRWSANYLRNNGKMKPVDQSPKGIWELK
jgi:hypothetical protein